MAKTTVYAETSSKCKRCARHFLVQESLQAFAGMADDPLRVTSVIQPLAKEFGPAFWTVVCGECALELSDAARSATEWQPMRSKDGRSEYYILSPDEERRGRTEGTPIKMASATKDKDAPTQSDDKPDFDSFPQTPVKTDEEKAADALSAFPKDTKVELIKTDYKGAQGTVQGVEVKRGVAYYQVSLEVAVSGARKQEPKVVLTRGSSLQAIDDFRPEPTGQPEPSDTPQEG